MGQQVLWRVESGTRALRDCVSEMVGVPVDDDRCEKIEPGNPEVLALGRPIEGTNTFRVKMHVKDPAQGLLFG